METIENWYFSLRSFILPIRNFFRYRFMRVVRKAMADEGWEITKPSLNVDEQLGEGFSLDLSPEPVFFAQRGEQKIAVLAWWMGSNRRLRIIRWCERWLSWIGYDDLVDRYVNKYQRECRSVFEQYGLLKLMMLGLEPERPILLAVSELFASALSEIAREEVLKNKAFSVFSFELETETDAE